jgi:hypothetical protein
MGMPTTARQPQDVSAPVKYIKWQSLYEKERPFYSFVEVPKDVPDQRTTNIVYEDRDTFFHDTRGEQSKFTLDNHGFTFRRHEFDFDDWENQQKVEEEYLPEVERIIKTNVEGADKIFFFDWRVWARIPFHFIYGKLTCFEAPEQCSSRAGNYNRLGQTD